MKTKVLMVCLGNICRSPLAEGVLRSKTNPNAVFVDSAGTAGFHIGEHPDPRSIAVAKNHGLDISSQQCRKFKASDLDTFDYIYVMDNNNYNNVIALVQNKADARKVKLLLSELKAGPKEVPDPYYGSEADFEAVYQLIDEACTVIAKKLEHNS